MKKTFYQLFILLGLIAYNIPGAKAQTYVCQGHSNGCANYAQILEIALYDSDGIKIFEKTPDACNGGANSYNVMSTKPSFSLESNKTYTIKFKVSANITINKNFSSWIDLNGDGDYKDVNEFVSERWGSGTGVQPEQNYVGGSTITETFTVGCASGPFAGPSRIRFRCGFTGGGWGGNNTAGSSEVNMSYGETEEFTFNLISDLTVSASFNGDVTAYKDVEYYMESTNGSKNFDWDENDDGYDKIESDNFQYTWNTTGTKKMKTRSQNCAGIDSAVRNINVIDVTKAPVVDFLADKTLATPGDYIKLTDLSQNGSSVRTWTIYDSFSNPVLTYTNSDREAGSSLKFPIYQFMQKGLYTVCLEASNNLGSDKLCKSNYIDVSNSNVVTLGNGGTTTTSSNGTIYDNGGVDGNYYGIATVKNSSVLIAPCGASSITLTVNEFDMADYGDLLFVFDGTDENATPLHPLGGFNLANLTTPKDIVATSGNMFVYYVSDATGYGKGFSATYKSVLGSTPKPNASWKTEYSDVYATANTKLISTTTNTTGIPRYQWTIEGKYYIGSEIEHTFSTPGNHEVCMVAVTCAGNDTSCSMVTAKAVTSATKAEFEADNTRPTTSEVVQFTATTDKANSYEWYIIPEGNYTYQNGTNKYSKNPQIKFNNPGCYEVIFKAWNTADRPLTTKTVQKIDYICVVKKCTPSVSFNSASIGISNVTISKGNVDYLVSNTSAGTMAYQDLSSSSVAKVLYGETYDVSISRPNIDDDWNVRAWLDVNGDGNFTPTEVYLQEGPDTTDNIKGTIKMPNYDVNLSNLITLRVSAGYNTQFNDPCFASVGEYEDYGINLTRDTDIPVITILNGDTVVIGKGALGYYLNNDLPNVGYTAMDQTEGDIASQVIVTTNLEEDVNGVYFIEYNVMDASGNKAETKRRIVKVVVDNEDPVITLNGASSMTIAVNDKNLCGRATLSNEDYIELSANATDNISGNLNSVVVISGAVDLTKTGTYILTYSVSDAAGNTSSVQRTVNIIDTIAPIINFNGSDKIDIGKAWVDQTSVCDNYDENINLVRTAGPKGFPDPYIRGTYIVYYSAVDAAGNPAISTQRVYTVGDNKAPTISINSSDTVIHDVNEPYNSIKATATDNFDKDIDISIVTYGFVDEFQLGVYEETFIAKDLSGNSDTAYRYVKVVDRVKPSISGLDIYTPLATEFNPMWGLSIKDNFNTLTELKDSVKVVSNNVNIHEEGVYSIGYEITDLSGNKSLRYIRNVFVGDYEATVGINDLDLNNLITVYPIPSNGNITLNIDSKDEITATLINVLGKEVLQLGTVKDGQLVDLSNQAKGIYFVKFTNGSSTVMKKIVLN